MQRLDCGLSENLARKSGQGARSRPSELQSLSRAGCAEVKAMREFLAASGIVALILLTWIYLYNPETLRQMLSFLAYY
jgi:hypothetical protein